ncbi:MAG: hypothetical protein NVS3B12_26610 [Acidimicrobiales bacterium]
MTTMLDRLGSAEALAPAPANGLPATRVAEKGSAALSVNGLSVRFGGVQAVDGVTFELWPAEILGVVGPNGAGKTTLFDAIGGFVPANGGVRLGDHEMGDAAPEVRARAGLGRSFQDAKLFPSLPVSEVLACAYERHIKTRATGVVSSALSMPWVRRSERSTRTRVDDLIELMGLGAFRDKFVSELSTGSRRIVDLAVIMAHHPNVLLLDEPSSGIAQRETEALGPLLLRIRAETGTAMILIEHDMPLVRSVSDRILALETGRVLLIGEPDEVLSDPRLVSAYLGTDMAVVERSGARTQTPQAAATTAPVRRKRPLRAPSRVPATGKAGAAGGGAAAGRPAPGATVAGRSAAGGVATGRSATGATAAGRSAAGVAAAGRSAGRVAAAGRSAAGAVGKSGATGNVAELSVRSTRTARRPSTNGQPAALARRKR